jgi:uncharacterized protein YdhG (YjbR/CyaY superfamily)
MKLLLETIKIGQPAHRALKGIGVENLEQLTQYSEDQLLDLHGFGPKALGILKDALAECGLSFKEQGNNQQITKYAEEESKSAYKTIDEYIQLFPAEFQEIMKKLRQVIKEAVPQAQEKISWQMPTFTLHGNLVHFAANKKHIGLYPGESGVAAFKDKITEYKSSKGAIQFPIDKPMPYELVAEIAKYRAAENIKWAEEKIEKKKQTKTKKE